MKKLSVLLYTLVCIAVISCIHHNGNVNIAYHDADQYYSMNADFSKSKTSVVEYYMDRKIGTKNNISFVNVQSDAILTLDDHTRFYMKKVPGHIEIKLIKAENSYEAYYKIKSMCEGMKKVLTK